MNRTKKLAVAALSIAMMGGSGLLAQVAPQVQQQVQVEVSDAELTKFANAYQEIQVENQKIQQEMVAVIEGEGLEVQRFNQIHEAEMSPQKNAETTTQEKAKYDKVVGKMEQKQTDFNTRFEAAVKNNGLTMNRYQEIGMALQSDQTLQQKLRSKMGAEQ